MLIKRQSDLSGKTRIIEIDVTQEQLDQWASGTLIQNAMPNLDDDDREFIMSGITPAEWDELFGSE